MLAAFAGLAVLAFPGRFMVARAQPGPRRQVRRGGEEFSGTGADLRDDRGGGQLADPGDGGQQVPLPGKRDHHRLDLGVQLRDHLVQVGDVVQVQLAHQRVMVIEAAF